ncbi:MAG: hypothetical protein R3F59_14495 [Myxococcota bacterium]
MRADLPVELLVQMTSAVMTVLDSHFLPAFVGESVPDEVYEVYVQTLRRLLGV